MKQAYPLVKRVDDDLKSMEENLVYKSTQNREKIDNECKDQQNTSKNSFLSQSEITDNGNTDEIMLKGLQQFQCSPDNTDSDWLIVFMKAN